MVPDQIERETVIDAPVERVWELITEAEHLGRWFGDAGAEIDLRPGGAMVLRWTEHGTSRGRVVAVPSPRSASRLSTRQRVGSASAANTPSAAALIRPRPSPRTCAARRSRTANLRCSR